MGVHGTIRHTVRHRIHHPVLRFAIRLLSGSRIRANLRAERTAGTFWTFLACQREDSSTRWKVLGSTGVFGSPDSSTDWRNWDSEVAVSGRISPLTGRIGLLMGLSAG